MSAKPAFLWRHFESLEQQRDTTVLGMWFFLATEILVFGAIFTAYIVYRQQYPADFERASLKLNLPIAAINTIVLLGSSLTMALSVRAAQLNRQRGLLVCLTLTALLGAAFLGFKVLEYYLDYADRLVPGFRFDPAEWGTPEAAGRVQLFLVFYYVLTGLHAVHLTIGILVLLVILAFAARGWFSPAYYIPIEVWGLYWHFVDVVWIFLLPLLYLIGRR
jgi:cytochrome c oxidase subunit 3